MKSIIVTCSFLFFSILSYCQAPYYYAPNFSNTKPCYPLTTQNLSTALHWSKEDYGNLKFNLNFSSTALTQAFSRALIQWMNIGISNLGISTGGGIWCMTSDQPRLFRDIYNTFATCNLAVNKLDPYIYRYSEWTLPMFWDDHVPSDMNPWIISAIYFNTVPNNNIQWNVDEFYMSSRIDFQTVACHEIGHQLGLAHQTVSNELMTAGYWYPPNRISYSQYDKSALNALVQRQTTGIGDGIAFGPNYDEYGTIYNSTDVLLGTDYLVFCPFIDISPYGSYLVSQNVKIVLYHEAGTYQLCSNNNVANRPILSVGQLPQGYCWSRNQAGYITGYVKVEGVDNGGKSYSKQIIIQVKNGSTITTNGILSNNESWECNVNLFGNVFVPIGKSLLLKTGSNLLLNGYSLISTGGTIIVESGANVNCAFVKQAGSIKGIYPTIQAAIDNASANQVVELQPRVYGEGFNVPSGKSDITITGSVNATINGSSISGATRITVQGIKINGMLSLNNCSYTSIDNVSFLSTGGMVLDYNSLSTNMSNSSDIEGGASMAFTSYGGTGGLSYNTIRGFDCAVFLRNYASYLVGSGNQFCGNGNDIDASPGSGALAVNNTYSRYPYPVTDNVDWSGTSSVCSGAKSISGQSANAEDGKQLSSPSDDSVIKQFINLIGAMLKNRDFKTIEIAGFNQLLSGLINSVNLNFSRELNKDSFKSNLALLSQLHGTAKTKADFYNSVSSLLKDKKYSAYYPYINRYNIRKAMDDKDYQQAVSLASEIQTTKNIDADLTCELLYEKGLIYKNNLDDYNKAKECFTALISNYKNHLLAKYAENELTGLTLAKSVETKKQVEAVKEIKGISLKNYPNPFNPATKVVFAIEEPGNVKLTVYNTLGQRVTELVNDYRDKGSYTVLFDGSKLSSGVYITVLQAGNKQISSKMFLIK